MALLNEKRNRIPLVATLPVTGDDNGIRGQMRMSAAGITDDTVYCLRSDTVETKSVLTIGAGDIAVTFTSKLHGIAGDAITIEYTDNGDGGVATASATGTDIVVTGDITTTGTADANEVVAAILADADSLALVGAVAGGDGSGLISITAQTNLADGDGVKAVQTFNTNLVLTALVGGRIGNDITLTIVDVTGAASVTVTVDGKAITVTGDSVSDLTSEMVTAINNSTRANKLVVASGGGATALAGAGAAPLVNGASNTIWTT